MGRKYDESSQSRRAPEGREISILSIQHRLQTWSSGTNAAFLTPTDKRRLCPAGIVCLTCDKSSTWGSHKAPRSELDLRRMWCPSCRENTVKLALVAAGDRGQEAPILVKWNRRTQTTETRAWSAYWRELDKAEDRRTRQAFKAYALRWGVNLTSAWVYAVVQEGVSESRRE